MIALPTLCDGGYHLLYHLDLRYYSMELSIWSSNYWNITAIIRPAVIYILLRLILALCSKSKRPPRTQTPDYFHRGSWFCWTTGFRSNSSLYFFNLRTPVFFLTFIPALNPLPRYPLRVDNFPASRSTTCILFTFGSGFPASSMTPTTLTP